ncbi:unnamed protein product [Allacma fusca]|uniref:Uncharacterized protein n=1 Tax=Allacma fusca TaxID=39272 RepID=A0A8J2JJU8_9HEXA|nr:unnamed protein product [Allacma fusca]
MIKARIDAVRIPIDLQKINWLLNKSGSKSIVMRNEDVLKILELLKAWCILVTKFNSIFKFPMLFGSVQLGVLILYSIFVSTIPFPETSELLTQWQFSLLVGVAMDIFTFLMVCIAGSRVYRLSSSLEKISVELLNKDTRQELLYTITRLYAKPVEIRPADLLTFNCGLITSC